MAKKSFIRHVKIAASTVMTFFMGLGTSMTVYAEELKDSQLVRGTENLIKDITSWLMILAPVVTVLLVIYFAIRRGAADEMDQKKWNNRIMVAVVSCIGAILASALITLVTGYYK